MTREQQEKLVIVIPAYNEEMNIEAVVKQWHPVAEKTGGQSRLYVIDDGSKDGTEKKLRQLTAEYPGLCVVSKKNQGHGATIYYGYRLALEDGADYIFQTDSDGQTLPEDFAQLWEHRKECGLMIGSRRNRQDGWQRVLVTRVLRFVIRVTFGCRVEDANTPFRLMEKKQLSQVLDEIPKEHSLTNVLMSVFYTKHGWNVQYFPITFRPRQGGKNSINMKRIIGIGNRALCDFWRLGRKK